MHNSLEMFSNTCIRPNYVRYSVSKYLFWLSSWGHCSNKRNNFFTFDFEAARKLLSHFFRGQFFVHIRSLAPMCPTFYLENLPLWSTELCKKLGAKVMKKELNHLASKRWEKVMRQELHSIPYKQEINPR